MGRQKKLSGHYVQPQLGFHWTLANFGRPLSDDRLLFAALILCNFFPINYFFPGFPQFGNILLYAFSFPASLRLPSFTLRFSPCPIVPPPPPNTIQAKLKAQTTGFIMKFLTTKWSKTSQLKLLISKYYITYHVIDPDFIAVDSSQWFRRTLPCYQQFMSAQYLNSWFGWGMRCYKAM